MSKNHLQDKLFQWLFLIIAICAFIYVITRAYLMEITNDEAYSLLLVDTNYIRAMIGTANTHWLNSLFLKIFIIFVGSKTWMIRLQSILVFPIFAYFLYRFFIKLSQPISKITLISLFLVNLYVLEYFSLARGYAMSLTFITASMYYAYKIIDKEEPKYSDYLKLLIFGILSLFSNYTVLFQFVGIFTFPAIYFAYRNKNVDFIKTRKYKVLIVLFSIAISTAIINLLMIKFLSNDLQFGGEKSFFCDTLESIIQYVLYTGNRSLHPSYFTYGSVLLFLLLSYIFGIAIIKKNKAILFFASLFFFQFIINNLLFTLFKTPFPFNRSALTLFPAMAFSIIFMLERIITPIKYAISIVILGTFIYIFINSYSIRKSYEWPQQSQVEEALDEINKIAKIENIINPKVTLSISSYAVWSHYYQHFYNHKYNYDVSLLSTDTSTNIDHHIVNSNFVVTTKEIDLKQNPKLKKKIDSIKKFPLSGIMVYSLKM
jgi:hypothetical protein